MLVGDPFLTAYVMIISTTCATLQLSPLKELLLEFKLRLSSYDGELLRVSGLSLHGFVEALVPELLVSKLWFEGLFIFSLQFRLTTSEVRQQKFNTLEPKKNTAPSDPI